MNNQKIKLKELDRKTLEVMNEAAHTYALSLREFIHHNGTAQAHIHYSILSKYGYEVFKKATAPHAPAKGSISLEVYSAFVACDSLQHYLGATRNELHKAISRRLIDDLDSLLPATKDRHKLSMTSELKTNN